MNILFFSHLFYPHIGGVEKHVLEVSRELIKRGHRITVVTEKFNKKLKAKEEYEEITIYRIPVPRNEWLKKFFIWFWILRHLSIIRQATIIHCHDVFFWYLPFRFIFLTKKVFTTFHGYEGNNLPKKRAILMHKIAEILSNGNICVGAFISKWYGTKPTTVIYGGVHLPKVERDIDIPKKEKIIRCVFLGRLEEETGIMTYLEAIKILQKQEYKFTVHILGDGLLRKAAESFVKKNNIDAHFYGFLENVDVYLSEAHVVFVSRYLGILEAMSCKKLVFAVYNNRIKEDYLRLTPFKEDIVIARHEHELAEEFSFFVQNPKLVYKKIDKGYSFVEKNTWMHIAEKYVSLWKA